MQVPGAPTISAADETVLYGTDSIEEDAEVADDVDVALEWRTRAAVDGYLLLIPYKVQI
jgi:hypothetical protein